MSATPKRVAIRAGARVVLCKDPYAKVENNGTLLGTAYGFESGIPSVVLDDGREVIVKARDCEVVP